MNSRPQRRFGSALKPMRGDVVERSPDCATAMASDILDIAMSSNAYFVLRRGKPTSVWAGFGFGHDGCAARESSAWTLPGRTSWTSDPGLVMVSAIMWCGLMTERHRCYRKLPRMKNPAKVERGNLFGKGPTELARCTSDTLARFNKNNGASSTPDSDFPEIVAVY